jgi:hypothetical protein
MQMALNIVLMPCSQALISLKPSFLPPAFGIHPQIEEHIDHLLKREGEGTKNHTQSPQMTRQTAVSNVQSLPPKLNDENLQN